MCHFEIYIFFLLFLFTDMSLYTFVFFIPNRCAERVKSARVRRLLHRPLPCETGGKGNAPGPAFQIILRANVTSVLFDARARMKPRFVRGDLAVFTATSPCAVTVHVVSQEVAEVEWVSRSHLSRRYRFAACDIRRA